jgi:hypothetical protein
MLTHLLILIMCYNFIFILADDYPNSLLMGRRGRDRMAFRPTTTYAISRGYACFPTRTQYHDSESISWLFLTDYYQYIFCKCCQLYEIMNAFLTSKVKHCGS